MYTGRFSYEIKRTQSLQGLNDLMRVFTLFNLKPQFCVAELQFEPLFQLQPTFFPQI